MEVIKHSGAVSISNKITLLQRRCWNLLLANAYDELLDKETFTIDLKELMDALGFDSKNLDYLKESLEALVKNTVKWNVLGKDKAQEWGVAALLGEVKITKGMVIYSYVPTIRKSLYNPSMYAKINLLMQNRFDSKYALALYELCVDYFISNLKRGETPFIYLDDLRLLLGVESTKSFANFPEFNRRVLKSALKEINEKSDLLVEIEKKKEGRRVAAIKFIIKSKKDTARPSIEDVKEDEYLHYLTLLRKRFLLGASQAEEILEKYSDYKFLDLLLREIEEKYKNKEISNLGAYAYKFLMEHPGLIESEIDVEIKRKREFEDEILKKFKEEVKYINGLQEEFYEVHTKKINDYIEKNRKKISRYFPDFRKRFSKVIEITSKGRDYNDDDTLREIINGSISLMKIFRSFLASKVLDPKYNDFIEWVRFKKKKELVKVGDRYFLKDGEVVKNLDVIKKYIN